ncbi:rRNA-binding ribosome biosynthesis protein utp25 [Tulasnella sp. 403]|nr:rRNA-binding ribosome biosynthesis protein utp25 [Tulasnella sp. 403]
MTEQNITTAKLLALLNVNASRPRKRRREEDDSFVGSVKLNKRQATTVIGDNEAAAGTQTDDEHEAEVEEDDANQNTDQLTNGVAESSWDAHFKNNTIYLSSRTLEAVQPPGEHGRVRWKHISKPLGPGRSITSFTLEDKEGEIDFVGAMPPPEASRLIDYKLWEPFQKRAGKLPENLRNLQDQLLPELLRYRDVHHTYISASNPDEQSAMRDTVSMHLANHVRRLQQDISRNNRLVSQTQASDKAPIPEAIQDQGFTRPTTLILVPFKNSALRWITSYLAHFPLSGNREEAISERKRLAAAFALPEGTVDKLAAGEGLGVYPEDHVQTFKGNIDDNFRMGIRVVGKVLKPFTNFFASDIIIASPLGLRLAIERDGTDDFLSSIEIVVVDQADVLAMQNWTHLQFVIEHLNNLPKGNNNTDFSRVKSWYLDGHAKYLRQNIVMSSYETPQIRAFFTNEIRNVAGKVRFERRWPGVQIPEGVKLNFVKFESVNSREEMEKRFEFFTNDVFPGLRKSAVQSANTLIFVPSYFDFIRLRNWLRKQDVEVAFLTEDSTASEMQHARSKFERGEKSFLVVTERYHFFRRYKLKGILNLVFYGPPDHAIFYQEFLSFPFLKKDVEGADVTCKILYSRYDLMALERIVGSREASSLIKGV